MQKKVIVYKLKWQGETTNGYNIIKKNSIKQEIFYEDSITTQSYLLEKIFNELCGEPQKELKKESTILIWDIKNKKIKLKEGKDFIFVKINNLEK